MSYQERLETFAQKAELFLQARVHERFPDGSLITGGWRLVHPGERCECCGTQRLKVIYPLVADGQVFWVGQECLRHLDEIGKIKVEDGVPPIVETEGRWRNEQDRPYAAG